MERNHAVDFRIGSNHIGRIDGVARRFSSAIHAFRKRRDDHNGNAFAVKTRDDFADFWRETGSNNRHIAASIKRDMGVFEIVHRNARLRARARETRTYESREVVGRGIVEQNRHAQRHRTSRLNISGLLQYGHHINGHLGHFRHINCLLEQRPRGHHACILAYYSVGPPLIPKSHNPKENGTNAQRDVRPRIQEHALEKAAEALTLTSRQQSQTSQPTQ